MTAPAPPIVTPLEDDEKDLFEAFEAQFHNETGEVCHLVEKQGRMSAGELVAWAYRNGYELTAICGLKWVPTKDPNSLPLCQACVAEWGRIVGH